MNILDCKEIEKIFSLFCPQVVIHCAGEGRAWMAAQNPTAAYDLNITGLKNIIKECSKYKSHLVFLSSNAVYDGETPPYNEQSDLHAVNIYGKIKINSEKLINEYLFRRTIIRPMQVYGWPPHGARENMASLTIKQLRGGMETKAAIDLMVQPTYAEDLAKAIWDIIKIQKTDEYVINIAAEEKMSLYNFCLRVCKTFDLSINLLKGTTHASLTIVRPLDTCFDVSKLKNIGIKMHTTEIGLLLMKGNGHV
jgi:dTDP-4-dehydrorhamnose reductase